MSNVAIAFVDARPTGFPGMEYHFKLAHKVVLTPYGQDLYVDKAIPIENMCLTELASAMVANLKPGYSALIYTHGEPANLLFPIDYESSKKNYLDVKDAARLSYHVDQMEDTHRAFSGNIVNPYLAQKYTDVLNVFSDHKKGHYDDLTPDYLKISDSLFADRLMDNIKAIREFKMPHLAIRACRIGQNRNLMKSTGMLFGAKTVSAPRLRTASVFGPAQGAFRFVSDPKALDKALEVERHGVNGVHKYEYKNFWPGTAGEVPWHVTFTVQRKKPPHFDVINRIATNVEALTEFLWKTAHYDALISQVLNTGYFTLHGLDAGNRLIFPGEQDYMANMAFIAV